MLTLLDPRAPEPSPAELFRHPSLAGPVPLIAVGADGVIEQTNQAVAEMLGYLESDLIGRRLNDITAWDSRCTNPREQVALLEDRLGGVTTWLHARGNTVRAIVARIEKIWANEPYFLILFMPVESAAA